MSADTAQKPPQRTAEASPRSGSTREVQELMVARARDSFARLPMLEVAFDRFALSLAQVLRSYFGGVAETELTSIDYLTCQDAVADLPNVALIAVTDADAWGGTIAAVVSPELLFNIVEVTFGGRMCPSSAPQTRNFTGIEKRVGRAFCDTVLTDLSAAFDKVSPVTFRIDYLETNPRGLLIAPPTSACVRAVISVQIDQRVGEMVFLLPNTAFEQVSHVLSQHFTGGQLGGDSGWRRKMTDMLGSSSIELAAVMQQVTLPLRDVLSWTPGQVLDLGLQADDPVTLRCAGLDIALAEVGRRKNGRVALKFTEKLYQDEELSDVLRD
ncbi:flagellar motor switch protein FliM [Marinovum sp.]|uniref:flagellar motor switch protein FliM n=1 Tax=Marinovum sp. TaxID=2024839 RepID=UPI002B265FC8|nr:FliM/FliN family flagellar motor switch protein [Marinovum sp.]